MSLLNGAIVAKYNGIQISVEAVVVFWLFSTRKCGFMALDIYSTGLRDVISHVSPTSDVNCRSLAFCILCLRPLKKNNFNTNYYICYW